MSQAIDFSVFVRRDGPLAQMNVASREWAVLAASAKSRTGSRRSRASSMHGSISPTAGWLCSGERRDRCRCGDRRVGAHRLPRPSVRNRQRGSRRKPSRQMAVALPGGRGLRGDEHHAAVGVGVVGKCQRHHARDTGFLPLAVRLDCAADGRLCRPAVLSKRLARPAGAPGQYGCADIARDRAGALACRWWRPPTTRSTRISTPR